MVPQGQIWIFIILVLNGITMLQTMRQWGERQLFPSSRIPEEALSTRRPATRHKIVLYHNFFRTKVRPTASNMLLMTWHEDAARTAQRHAERCLFLVHSMPGTADDAEYGQCGENLFVASQKTPWFFALKSWFLEYKKFKYGHSRYNLKEIGHYTQMNWATTHKVGCGVARCAGGPWGHFYNYVCHYCPGGNIIGITEYPYKPGKPCADCPDSCVQGKLCANHCPARDFYSNCAEISMHDGVCTSGRCNATCMCAGKRIHKNYPWD